MPVSVGPHIPRWAVSRYTVGTPRQRGRCRNGRLLRGGFLAPSSPLWKRKLPHLTCATVEGVLSEMARTCPAFHLPPATLGHTRHWMPLDSTDESKRTKVFDAFVSLAKDAEVVFHWVDAKLTDGEQTLALLLSQLGYFGRAESWCIARLLPEFDTRRINCTPGSTAVKQESVRVLTADPASWSGWAFTNKNVVRPDPPWNLLAETADLHLERWSDPPGSKWVTYARPADCFAPRPAPRPVLPGDAKTEFIVARFVLDVAEGRRPLPLVTETLPFAEEVRRQLGREYAVYSEAGTGVSRSPGTTLDCSRRSFTGRTKRANRPGHTTTLSIYPRMRIAMGVLITSRSTPPVDSPATMCPPWTAFDHSLSARKEKRKKTAPVSAGGGQRIDCCSSDLTERNRLA